MTDDNIHIFEYLHLLRRRKYAVLISFMSIFGFVCLINLIERPIYRTSVEMMIDKQDTNLVLGTNVLTVNTPDSDYFFAQKRILMSKSLAEKVSKRILEDASHLDLMLKCFGIERPEKGQELNERQRESLIGSIQRAVDLNTASRSRVFYITVTGHDPNAITYL